LNVLVTIFWTSFRGISLGKKGKREKKGKKETKNPPSSSAGLFASSSTRKGKKKEKGGRGEGKGRTQSRATGFRLLLENDCLPSLVVRKIRAEKGGGEKKKKKKRGKKGKVGGKERVRARNP